MSEPKKPKKPRLDANELASKILGQATEKKPKKPKKSP